MNYSFLDFLGQIYNMQKQLDGQTNAIPLNTANYINEQSSWNILLSSPIHQGKDPQISNQQEIQKTQILSDINIGGKMDGSLHCSKISQAPVSQAVTTQAQKKPVSKGVQKTMKYHPNKFLICRVCNKGFSHNYSLRKHLKNLHNIVDPKDNI